MARNPTAGIGAALTATINQPGYLLQMTVGAQVFRLCSLDVGFSYGGYTWTSADIEIDDLRWDTGGAQPGRMTLGDPDLVWWTFALNLQLQNAPVLIWQVYASASGEAEPLWSGRIGRVRKGDLLVECALITDGSWLFAPRRRVQDVVPAKYLLPPGKVITIGTTDWTLERKQNG